MIKFAPTKKRSGVILLTILLASFGGLDKVAQAQSSALEINPASSLEVEKVDNPEKASEQPVEQATVAALIKQGNDAYVEAEYEKAIEFYSQAIERFNTNAYAYYNRGNSYRKLKQADAALKDYAFAIRLNPENIYAYYYRGILLSEAEEYEQALLHFSEALKLTNQNPAIYERRAKIYSQLKDKDAAKKDYQKAIDLYQKQGKNLKADILRRKTGIVSR